MAFVFMISTPGGIFSTDRRQIGSDICDGLDAWFFIIGEDRVVPLEPNSVEFARRYADLGGKIEVIVEKGWGHGRDPKFYESERAIEFLLA